MIWSSYECSFRSTCSFARFHIIWCVLASHKWTIRLHNVIKFIIISIFHLQWSCTHARSPKLAKAKLIVFIQTKYKILAINKFVAVFFVNIIKIGLILLIISMRVCVSGIYAFQITNRFWMRWRTLPHQSLKAPAIPYYSVAHFYFRTIINFYNTGLQPTTFVVRYTHSHTLGFGNWLEHIY